MARHPACFLLLAALLAPSAHGEVRVRFHDPEKFKDFILTSGPPEAVLKDLMRQVDEHLRALGEQYLPKGDVLEIDVEDIDMAGGYEHWRMPDLTWTRIMADIYPPIITMAYVWKDGQSKLKAQNRVVLTNRNWRWNVGQYEYPVQDQLRFEKALLKGWFVETFGAGEKGR